MKFLGKVVLATLAVAGGNVHAALGSSDSLNFLVMGDWGGKDCLIGHD